MANIEAIDHPMPKGLQMREEVRTQPIILRYDDVMKITGLGRSSIKKMTRAGTFPPSVKLTARATGWVADEVHEWLRKRIEARSNF